MCVSRLWAGALLPLLLCGTAHGTADSRLARLQPAWCCTAAMCAVGRLLHSWHWRTQSMAPPKGVQLLPAPAHCCSRSNTCTGSEEVLVLKLHVVGMHACARFLVSDHYCATTICLTGQFMVTPYYVGRCAAYGIVLLFCVTNLLPQAIG
jgi:hypothetical protein